uniref:TBC1 domain family member 15 n=1 Tax=Denticeps clupeoides TaxID=299321 RepID=A0AAY4DFP1_9TELE
MRGRVIFKVCSLFGCIMLDLACNNLFMYFFFVKDGEAIVDYKPLEDAVDPTNMLCAGGSNHMHERNKWAFSISAVDLKSITVSAEGWTHVTFHLKDDTALPTIHFHQGGSEGFMECLRKCVHLSKSVDESLFFVSAFNKALSQSFENLLDDTNYGLVQKLKKDPYTTTLGGFSKVTNYIYDAFRGSDLEYRQRPPEEMADLLGEVIPGLEINQQEEPGFEVITRVDLGPRPVVRRREPLTVEGWLKYQDPEGRMRNVPDLKKNIFKGGLCHAARKEAWKFLLGFFPWESTYEERKVLQKRKTDEYFRMKLQWRSVSEEQERRNSKLRDYKSLIEKDVNRTDRNNKYYEGLDNPGLILLHDILMTYCMYDFDLGYVQGMSDLLSPILFVMESEVDAFWCFVSFMDQLVSHDNFEEQMQGMKTQLIQLSTLLRLLDLAFWNYLESQDSGYLYFCFRWLLIRFKRELHFPDVLRLWEVMWTGLPCQNFHLLVCCAILDSEKQKIMDRHYGFNEILKHINELSMKLDIEEILHKSESICLQIKNCKVRVCLQAGVDVHSSSPSVTRQLLFLCAQDIPPSVGEILGLTAAYDTQTAECGKPDSSHLTRALHRPEQAVSNGHRHLTETPRGVCTAAFIS